MATISNRDKFFWYVEGERLAVVQKKEKATPKEAIKILY